MAEMHLHAKFRCQTVAEISQFLDF